MRAKNFAPVLVALLAVLGSVTAASASDSVRVAASISAGQRPAIILENGNPYANGTFAIGTIHILYTYTGYQFPVGEFAVFNLAFGIKEDSGNPNTGYPTVLTLDQQSGTDVVLAPETAEFAVTGRSWTGNTLVRVSISPGVPSEDGTELVGHLRLAAPGGAHLDTPPNILVKIKLVHPSACLKLYHFVTDQDFTTRVTSTEVNVNRNKGTITSTNPFGQLSSNVLVANTCGVPQTFDVAAMLDDWFSTNPAGNPGNAVFTFTTAGEMDIDSFNITSFGAGTPRGQSLCIPNITLASGETLLMSVHTGINKGDPAGGLGTSGSFAGFGAQLYQGGSGCSTALTTAVLPANPAMTAIAYTVK